MTNEQILERYHRLHRKESNRLQRSVQAALKEQVTPIAMLVAAGDIGGANMALIRMPMLPMATAIKKGYASSAVNYGWMVAREIKKELKVPEDFIASMEAFISEYFRSYLLENAVLPIDQYTKELILRELTFGKNNGDGYDVIARRIKDIGLSKVRAARIARTETAKALQAGAELSAKRSGVVFEKVWLSAQSVRTRRLPRDQFDHLTMNGKKVGMNEYFEVPKEVDGVKGVEKMLHPCDPTASPGNVIQCRCTVAYKPKRDADGNIVMAEGVENNFVQLI